MHSRFQNVFDNYIRHPVNSRRQSGFHHTAEMWHSSDIANRYEAPTTQEKETCSVIGRADNQQA